MFRFVAHDQKAKPIIIVVYLVLPTDVKKRAITFSFYAYDFHFIWQLTKDVIENKEESHINPTFKRLLRALDRLRLDRLRNLVTWMCTIMEEQIRELLRIES